MLNPYHLPTVKAILGESLIKDLHLVLVKFGHHQFQLLVRMAPWAIMNNLDIFSSPLLSLMDAEEMPTVPIDRPHSKSWWAIWISIKQNVEWRFEPNILCKTSCTPEPALNMELRLEASSSQLLQILEVENIQFWWTPNVCGLPVWTWLLARFHEVPPRVHNTLAHNYEI